MTDDQVHPRYYIIAVAFTAAMLLISAANGISISTADNLTLSTTIDGKDFKQIDASKETITKPTAAKLTILKDKSKLEPVVQLIPGTQLVISADFQAGEIHIVQSGTDYIEGYTSYGKSLSSPWGVYWSIYADKEGYCHTVYAEFATKRAFVGEVSYKQFQDYQKAAQDGKIPDVYTIQHAVGVA